MMNLDNLRKFEQNPPRISDAFIHSFVKQQTSKNSSKAKEIITMNTNNDTCCVSSSSRSLSRHGKVLGPQLTQPQQYHKKYGRRMLHTSRHYQERLMNMAKARKEIIHALKIHRASKKQASEQQPQLHQQQQAIQVQKQHHQHHQVKSFQLFNCICLEQSGKFNSIRESRTFPSSCMNNFSNTTSIPNSYYTVPFANSSQISPPLAENPNFTSSLPNQAIGLNLHLDNFNKFNDATIFLNNNNSSSLSYSSPTSSCLPLSVVVDQEVPLIGTSQEERGSFMVDNNIESMATLNVNEGLHTTMDDEGIQEIKSLTEQYQMEWNDTMDLFSSTWWSNFFNNMDHGGAPEVVKNEGDAFYDLGELTEFPSSSSLHANERCVDDYFKDSTLSDMDIGDIDFEDYDEK